MTISCNEGSSSWIRASIGASTSSPTAPILSVMDASAYAFVHGLRSTRATLRAWNRRPWPVLTRWLAGSLAAACTLLLAVWAIALVARGGGGVSVQRPPFRVGDPGDVVRILTHNALVLALHAMACVAGFIAGSSLPLQAPHRRGIARA